MVRFELGSNDFETPHTYARVGGEVPKQTKKGLKKKKNKLLIFGQILRSELGPRNFHPPPHDFFFSQFGWLTLCIQQFSSSWKNLQANEIKSFHLPKITIKHPDFRTNRPLLIP